MIAVETDGDVRTVTLDRPARRNALRGTGSAFYAGADLDAVAGLSDRAAAERFAARGQAVTRAIETRDAVVVAGVDGPAGPTETVETPEGRVGVNAGV